MKGSSPFLPTMEELHIDIETYSSVDIKSCGNYKYSESLDFEILLVAYAFGSEPVKIVDLAQGKKLPSELTLALADPNVLKCAHNANFERKAFDYIGYKIPINEWFCSAVKSAYCGLPLNLEGVSNALELGDKSKSATGKALIKYFTMPCKPTKVNGGRNRNLPEHDLEKWQEFKDYCVQDVVAEREIHKRLSSIKIPKNERLMYQIDQKINDTGILIDTKLASNAYGIDNQHSQEVSEEIIFLTSVENPNSLVQLKEWLGKAMNKEIDSLAKDAVNQLIKEAEREDVKKVLALRQKLSKSSTKKYTAMLNCVCEDGRAHGLFQFYGANRTGRWAGRLIQLQNLPRNSIKDLDLARNTVRANDYDNLGLYYDNIPKILSELIRTAFVPAEGKTFAVADFSAIEARVIAWVAREMWRIDVFKTHGKIYEASGSKMFNVPIEQVTKGSELRYKAKIAELALGYQGAVGALKKMGGEEMGLSESEMKNIVNRWRTANKKIVQLWADIEEIAKTVIRKKTYQVSKYAALAFGCDKDVFYIRLPSNRKLYYQSPELYTNDFGMSSIRYKGMNQTTRKWEWVDTYGGKLVENIVQAIARDLLAHCLIKLDAKGFKIVMHVHDEIVCETTKEYAEDNLKEMERIMSTEIDWAKGLPLAADGYLTDYYKKD